MNDPLTGSTALVTGSTSGIGRATATALAHLGAHVIITGRDAERGEKAVAEIHGDGGSATFVEADLSSATGPAELARAAAAAGGGHVHIIVNNAGIFPLGPTSSFTAADVSRVYDSNVRAPFLLVGILAPQMVERGHGVIINLGSIVAKNGANGGALYGSTKAALVLLTKAWAAEFGPGGVRVNAVSPGPTYTEGSVVLDEMGLLEAQAAGTPAGDVGTPSQVAAAIAFLAGADSIHIHGVDLAVDGGKAAV